MTFKKKLSEFWRDETGQSTTEYILILAVVVMIASKFKGQLDGVVTRATGNLNGAVDGIFQGNP